MLSHYNSKTDSVSNQHRQSVIQSAKENMKVAVSRLIEVGYTDVQLLDLFKTIQREQKALLSDIEMNSTKKYKREIEQASGSDLAEFKLRVNHLEQKWETLAKKDEYEETRIISPLLQKITPIGASIISDNLDFFKESYKTTYGEKLLLPLKQACLCGSERIASFLLEQLQKDYTSEGYEFVLVCASASDNTRWVEKIATEVAKTGRSLPDHVYTICNDDLMLESIIDKFPAQNSKCSLSF